MKQARADTNYPILTKRVKLQHEKKPLLTLKSIESVRFEQKFTYWDLHSAKIISLREKCVVGTILVATGSSSVRCFGLYLINIFMNSTKSERCTEIMLKPRLYCLPVTVQDLNL